MSNQFNSPQFKKLAKEWNKKLTESGHKEIEDFSMPDAPLLRNEAIYFRNINHSRYEATLLYYEKARDLLNTFKFKNELHRRIWSLHSEGVPVRKISKIINRRLNKTWINEILKQIRKEIR